MNPNWRTVKLFFAGIGGVFAILCLICVVLFIGIYIIRPRRILHRFDELCLRHPVGSPVAGLIDDPFIEDASMGGHFSPLPTASAHQEALSKLRADIKARPSGSVDLMWTHTPPYGRVILGVDFDAGRITALRQSELD